MTHLFLSKERHPRKIKETIFYEIVDKIKKSELSNGDKLPSIRELAEQVKVSKLTIEEVYADLVADGWVDSIPKKGYFVIFSTKLKISSDSNKLSYDTHQSHTNDYIFNTGGPDSELVPIREIYKHVALLDSPEENSNEYLANYIQRSKGITNGVLIPTSGSLEALYIILNGLNIPDKSQTLAVEEYTYKKVINMTKGLNYKIISIKLNQEGIDLLDLEKKSSKIDLLFMTTQFQFPTTARMPLNKKLELINLSNVYGFTIIEDDYESEFFYTSYQTPSLYSLSEDSNIIFVSSFSNLVSSKFRVGYIIVNEKYSKRFKTFKELFSEDNSKNLNYRVFCYWIQSGGLEKFLRKSRKVYKKRSNDFTKLLLKSKNISKHFKLENNIEGGTATWIKCITKEPIELREYLESKNIFLSWSDNYSTRKKKESFVRIGFASMNEQVMIEKIIILDKALTCF